MVYPNFAIYIYEMYECENFIIKRSVRVLMSKFTPCQIPLSTPSKTRYSSNTQKSSPAQPTAAKTDERRRRSVTDSLKVRSRSFSKMKSNGLRS